MLALNRAYTGEFGSTDGECYHDQGKFAASVVRRCCRNVADNEAELAAVDFVRRASVACTRFGISTTRRMQCPPLWGLSECGRQRRQD